MTDSNDAGLAKTDVARIARAITGARQVVALTGAGLSVESGIPDFRSPGGLWEVFDPAEYATLSCFAHAPEKAWMLYRALGRSLSGREPNAAHRALADLERAGHLAGVVTQNVDGLHQRAGSRTVLEIHGNHHSLQCLRCGRLEPFRSDHLDPGPVPLCPRCDHALKPNVVLFEEAVRHLDEIQALIASCDLLLVAGTSAEVYPACALPEEVIERGGSVLEFNLGPTRLTAQGLGAAGAFIEGPVGMTLPMVARGVLHAA